MGQNKRPSQFNNTWIQKNATHDEDMLFTKFLHAGSARVLIPVHPAYLYDLRRVLSKMTMIHLMYIVEYADQKKASNWVPFYIDCSSMIFF
jgi:hypothetical protein